MGNFNFNLFCHISNQTQKPGIKAISTYQVVFWQYEKLRFSVYLYLELDIITVTV